MITLATAPLKAKRRKITKEQTNAKERGRQFIEVGTKVDLLTASIPSVESKRPRTDISGEKRKSPQAHPISKLSSDSDWYNCVPPGTPPPAKSRHDNKKTTVTIISRNEISSEVPGLVVFQPVNELFADAVDYLNFRLIKKSSRYDKYSTNKLDKMTRKTAVQMKDRTFNRKDPCR